MKVKLPGKARILTVVKDQSTSWVVRLVDVAYYNESGVSSKYKGLALCPVTNDLNFSLFLACQVNTCLAAQLSLDAIFAEGSSVALQVNGKDCQPREPLSAGRGGLMKFRVPVSEFIVGRPRCTVDLHFNNASPENTFLPLELNPAEPSPVIRQFWDWGVSLSAFAFHCFFWLAATLSVFATQAYFDILTRSATLRLLLSLTPTIAATLAALHIEWIKFRADAFPNLIIRRAGRIRWVFIALFFAVTLIAGVYDWKYTSKQAEILRVKAVRAKYTESIDNYFAHQDPKYLYDAFAVAPWRAEAHLLLFRYARQSGGNSTTSLPSIVFNDRVLQIVRSAATLQQRQKDIDIGSLDSIEDPRLWLAGILPEIELYRPSIPKPMANQDFRINALVFLACTGLDKNGEGALLAAFLRNELATYPASQLPEIAIDPQSNEFYIPGFSPTSIHDTYLALNRLRALIYADATSKTPMDDNRRLICAINDLKSEINMYESGGYPRSSPYYMEALDHLAQNNLDLVVSANAKHERKEAAAHIDEVKKLFRKVISTRTTSLRERRMQWVRGPEKLVAFQVILRPTIFKILKTSNVEQQYELLNTLAAWNEEIMRYRYISGEYALDMPDNWYIGTIDESMVEHPALGVKVTGNAAAFIHEMLNKGWRY